MMTATGKKWTIYYFTGFSASTTNQKNVKSAVSALNSTSNAFGNVASSGRLDSVENGIDESLKLKALAEEEAAMNQFKVRQICSRLT